MRKLVREKLIEGVGDKYAEQKFYIPQEFDEFQNTFNKSQIERDKIIQINERASVVKNPSSLDNFATGVRGVIDKKGNIYLALKNNCIHQTILDALNKMGLLEVSDFWYRKLPTTFITVQRYKNTNILAMGESNLFLQGVFEATPEEINDAYLPILWETYHKNPHIKITMKLISELEENPSKYMKNPSKIY